VFLDAGKIAGVGDDFGELLQLFELGRGHDGKTRLTYVRWVTLQIGLQPFAAAALVVKCAVELRFESDIENGLKTWAGFVAEGDEMAALDQRPRRRAFESEGVGFRAERGDELERLRRVERRTAE